MSAQALVVLLHVIFRMAIPYVFHFGHRTYEVEVGGRRVLRLPGWSAFTNRHDVRIQKIGFE